MLISPQAQFNKILTPLAGPHVKLSGKYQLTVHRDGVMTQQTPWFDNLILNQGLDYLGLAGNSGTSVNPFEYCQVGTGTSLANPAQTQLDAFLASVNATYAAPPNTSVSSGAPNYIRTNTLTFSFAKGAVIGNISEVGVGKTAANGQLSSRARIVDTGGNPTTLSLVAIDQLTVSYAISVVLPITNTTGSVILDGITYPYTAYTTDITNSCSGTQIPLPSNLYDRSPFLGVPGPDIQLSCTAGGTAVSPTILTDTPRNINHAKVTPTYSYSPGSYTGVSSVVMDPSQGNLIGGIQGIQVPFVFGYYETYFYVFYNFGIPIPKINTKTLKLDFSATWST